MVLGTMGYMSPEQVRGEPADARSDVFSFGAVLFEMLTGKKAFARDSHSETVAAILRDDPPEPAEASGRALPASLQRIIAHCLEKLPARRFQAAEDLAFALENLSTATDDSQRATAFSLGPASKAALPGKGLLLAAGGILALLAVGLAWGLGRETPSLPSFRRLTFVPGTIEAARFGSDGRTVYFSERVAAAKPAIFVLDPRSPGPKSLGVQDAMLLGVSGTDELAFLRSPRLVAGFSYGGTLVRVPGGGGEAREVQSDVIEAVWDGAGLATLWLNASSELHLEFPAGHKALVCNSNTRTLSRLSLSRDGRQLALVDGDYVKGAAEIVVYDREGTRSVVHRKDGDGSGATLTGMAWGPGDTLWFSELQGDQTTLWSLAPGKPGRVLMRTQGALQLLDVSLEGRVLLAQHQVRRVVLTQRLGEPQPRDLSVLSSTQALGLSSIGPRLLLVESPVMDGGTSQDRTYLRSLDGSPPLALGRGFGKSISADGRWVYMDTGAQEPKDIDPAWILAYKEAGLAAAQMTDPKARGRFALFVPTGLGRPFALALPEGFASTGNVAHLLPDGQRLVANLAKDGQEHWVLLDRRGGAPRILTQEGMGIAFASIAPLSPDGSRFIVGNGRDWFVLPLAGGAPQPVQGMLPGERVLGWSADGGAVFVRPELSVLPVAITRLELAQGRRTPVLAFTPPDPAGHLQTRGVFMTPDAQAFAFTCEKKLSELYLVEGLK
jgi:hypothetical protein